MAEYQGLVYTVSSTMKKTPTRIKKGKRIEAKNDFLQWIATWGHKKAMQDKVERRLSSLHAKISKHLVNRFGVLVVCEYRCHGDHEELHDVFIGAVALTRTNAMLIHRMHPGTPTVRLSPPHGWHICSEKYLWFDQTKQTNNHLDNDKIKKERDAKLNEGPKWGAVR